MNAKLKAVKSRAAAVWATRIGKAALLGGAAVALAGGGAVAATTLPTNSVGTAQIQNGAVTYPDLAWDSVASSRIQDHSVAWDDMAKDAASGYTLRDGTVAERDLAKDVRTKLNAVGTGEPGKSYGCDGQVVDAEHPAATCPGKDGTDGKPGTNGTDGVSGYEVVGRTADRMSLAAGETKTVTTLCAAGTVAVGGGGDAAGAGAAEVLINSTAPGAIKQVGPKTEHDPAGVWAATGWKVTATNTGDAAATVQPYVTCARIAPVS